MAATADSWKTTNIAQNPGRLYRGCAIPGAGSRPTLTSGTPDDASNPSAAHMGATKGGSRVMVKSELQNYTVDEFRAPIVTSLNAISMGISAEIVGVTDMQLMAYLMPGMGTRSTGSGYDYITIGSKAITYDCTLLTYPLIEDTTRYGWAMLYSSLNDSGVEWAQSRTELGGVPISLVAYEVTTRAAADTLGQIGKQIA